MSHSRLRIVLSGMIAGDPFQGGATWAVLQYLLGFRRLGHDVLFIEPVNQESLRPPGAGLVNSLNAEYFRQVAKDFELEGHAALLRSGSRETMGLSYPQLQHRTQQADVLINISGLLTDGNLISRIPARAYLDLDPAFNQLWATQGLNVRLDGHTHFVTIGMAMGQEHCRVPTCGRTWITTLQPIVLAHWPVARQIEHDGLTTVGNWRGYGSIEHEGVFYGQKAHSLRHYIALPRRTSEKFLPALAIHPGEERDLAALASNGWQLIDPAVVAHTPQSYQRF